MRNNGSITKEERGEHEKVAKLETPPGQDPPRVDSMEHWRLVLSITGAE